MQDNKTQQNGNQHNNKEWENSMHCSQHMGVQILWLGYVSPKSKWCHNMQDNKTQKNGTQHNNREYESLYATASI